ncbi:hypothetical protein BDV95DRAFT_595382 [Massariosphaeria phaeospora]|uniref:Uncharacterized protein n=1 Tax=Massariosphaeria phaeospora TaxID=100035 RepID=A0A7C8ICK2_9PLEO|nr:hypothetical protein BDV95DRAFT_595382 [Massariosphaeria phaeospora]
MDSSNSDSLLPPTEASFPLESPSGLTPNTRTEAELALDYNSHTQTDSAAPATSFPSDENANPTEAHAAYRRPGPVRTSSTNYQQALQKAHAETSASSNLSTDTTTTGVPFPPPGQGVVPLHTGVGVSVGQSDALKSRRPRGMSLTALAPQQSWSEQDMKHAYTANLLADAKDAGYSSKGVPPLPEK